MSNYSTNCKSDRPSYFGASALPRIVDREPRKVSKPLTDEKLGTDSGRQIDINLVTHDIESNLRRS